MDEQRNEEFLKKQNLACPAYGRLLGSFSADCPLKAEHYPNYYGGAYLDNDGTLVVNVAGADGNTALLSQIKSAADYDDVKLASVKYAYSRLKTVQAKISAHLTVDGDIQSVAVMDRENAVEVTLRHLTDETVTNFKRDVSDDECIVFAQSKGEIENCSDVGDAVYQATAAGTHRGTVAYRARTSAQARPGVVVSGHVALITGNVDVNVGGVFPQIPPNAIVKRWDALNGSEIDAAFCEGIDETFNPTNHLVGGGDLSLNTVLPVVGTIVAKDGVASGRTGGKIDIADIDIQTTTTIKTHQFGASMGGALGDSGSCVYLVPVSGMSADVVGVLCAVGGGHIFGSKAQTINTLFGITRY